MASDQQEILSVDGNIIQVVRDLLKRITHLERRRFPAAAIQVLLENQGINIDGACCIHYPVPHVLNGEPTGITRAGTLAITHETNAGVLYAEDIEINPPTWIAMNSGLTSGQYQTVNGIFVTPNGAVYAFRKNDNHTNSFIARANAVGEAFSIVLSAADIAALINTDYGLSGVDYNPNEPEEIMFTLARAGSNTIKFFFGANGSWTAGTTINGAASTNTSMKFGTLTDHWIVNIGGYVYIMPADVSSVLSTHAAGNYTMGDMSRSESGYTYFFPDDVLKINFATGDGASFTRDTSNDSSNFIVPDSTGLYLMAMNSAVAVRSIDGGHTWTTVPGLPANSFRFAWISGAGTASHWFAVGVDGITGGQIYYSDDGGSTWSARLGNVATFDSTPVLNVITVVPDSGLARECIALTDVEALQMSISSADSFTVRITGGLIQTPAGNKFVSATDQDLASHIPTSGVRFVGFRIDQSGAWSVVDGTPFALDTTPTDSNLPAPEAGYLLPLFVVLYQGITGLCENDFVYVAPTPTDYASMKTGYQIHNAAEVTELQDDDEIGIWNSLTGLIAKIKASNLVLYLKGIFDLIYASISHTHSIDTEAIQDIVGAMVSGNTETGIDVTYDDSTGKLDFDVELPVVGQYRQFVYVVSGGDFSFVIAGDGSPVMALQDLE